MYMYGLSAKKKNGRCREVAVSGGTTVCMLLLKSVLRLNHNILCLLKISWKILNQTVDYLFNLQAHGIQIKKSHCLLTDTCITYPPP